MAIFIRKNPGGARARKKRENLLMKQLHKLEEIALREEEERRQEAERIRALELAKRREEELRMEELRLQELLLREMDMLRMRRDRKRGKRLWTAEERMSQRIFAAALMETAAASAAHRAEQSGYAEGRVEMRVSGAGQQVGLSQSAIPARERQRELVALPGGLLADGPKDMPGKRAGDEVVLLGRGSPGGAEIAVQDKLQRAASTAAMVKAISPAVQLAERPSGRRRTLWFRDRRMRLPSRSPCLDDPYQPGSARILEEEVHLERS